MMKHVKMGIQLLRFTYGVKTAIGFSLAFLVLGIVSICVPIMDTFIGYFFILTIGMWPSQMLFSILVPDMVQTSAWKKELQTKVITAVGAISFGAGYVLALILVFIRAAVKPTTQEMLVATILVLGLTTFALMVYMAAALKLFKIATIVFFVFYVVGAGAIRGAWLEQLQLSVGAALVISVILFFLGIVVYYWLSCLLYRKPIAKGAQLNGLKKTL